jgi:ferrous iron transport protein A
MRRWGFRHRRKNYLQTPQIGNGVLSLNDAVLGKKYRIVRINGGCRLNSHLCAMGFIPYEVFSVSDVSRGGSLCVVVKGTKFAIGRGMAEKILIREIEG